MDDIGDCDVVDRSQIWWSTCTPLRSSRRPSGVISGLVLLGLTGVRGPPSRSTCRERPSGRSGVHDRWGERPRGGGHRGNWSPEDLGKEVGVVRKWRGQDQLRTSYERWGTSSQTETVNDDTTIPLLNDRDSRSKGNEIYSVSFWIPIPIIFLLHESYGPCDVPHIMYYKLRITVFFLCLIFTVFTYGFYPFFTILLVFTLFGYLTLYLGIGSPVCLITQFSYLYL